MYKKQLSKNGYVFENIFPDGLFWKIYDCNLSFIPNNIIKAFNSATREEYHVIDELRIQIINHLQPLIKELTPGINSLGSINLWRDNPGFYAGWHYDNPLAQNVILIFLDDHQNGIGTGYTENDQTYIVPYVKNNGLLLLNSDTIYHGMEAMVPIGVTRRLLYLNWMAR